MSVLAAVDASASRHPWPASQFEAACDQGVAGERALLILQSGQAVGFVVYQQVLDEASILNVAIQASWQRRGLARELMHTLFSELVLSGARRCLLEVRASNRAARCLYEQLGFVEDGIRRGYYSREKGREDGVLMSRAVICEEGSNP